jgi:uncharacterized protein (DUF1330 family)
VPAYFVVNANVKDMELLQEYVAETTALLPADGVEVLVIDDNVDVLEGSPAGSRLVVLEWNSKEAFRAFYDSPASQRLF